MATQDELVARYHAQVLEVRSSVGTWIGGVFLALADVDDPTEFAVAAAAASEAGQTQVADLLSALVALLLEDAGLPPVEPVDPTAVTGAAVRNGTPAALVYERAVVEIRKALADGRSWDQGMAAGRARAVAAAETDVMLTQRATMVALGEQAGDRIVGYRRVLTGRSCVLCGVASTQRYRRSELMPIHSHCDCGVAPIIGDRDPGKALNRQALRQLRADAGRADYWNARGVVDEQGRLLPKPNPDAVAVHRHGELGPVLTDSTHEFTGPGDLAA